MKVDSQQRAREAVARFAWCSPCQRFQSKRGESGLLRPHTRDWRDDLGQAMSERCPGSNRPPGRRVRLP